MTQRTNIDTARDPAAARDIAVTLLGTAMRDTEGPVMEMAGALTRISNILARGQSADGSVVCGGDCRALIRNDIAICIQSLQFHDRLIQQLTALRQLMGSEPTAGEQCSGFMPPEGSVELF
jgi:hypothetical protein